jgi:arylsulfatase A-like enzyme
MKPGETVQRGPDWPAWSVAAGLMGGAGQLVVELANRRVALSDPAVAIVLLAANAGLLALLAAVPLLAVRRLFLHAPAAPAALALALATGFTFTIGPEPNRPLLGLSIARTLLASAGAALAIWVFADRRVLGGRRLADVVLYAGPWLALAGAAWAWCLVWLPESRRTTLLAVETAVMLALVLGLVSLARREGARLGVAVALAALFLSSLASVASVRLRRGPPEPARSPGAVCGVLLTIDTLRADVLRPFEPAADSHPNLEALLAESVVFTQARSPAPWTKPSFASMLSGLPLGAHRATELASRVPEQMTMLAERLRGRGIRTLAIGDNPVLGPEFGFAQGFDAYRMYPLPSLGGSLAARLAHIAGLYETTASSERLTDLAIDALREHAAHSFFLWLHYLDPHTPFSPPDAYRPAGDPPPGMGGHWNDTHEARAGFTTRTPEQRRWVRQLYDAEVRYVDDQVGRFVAALRETGAWDRCAIAFASDHGEEFWEHRGFSHGHALYDESIRVPFALRAPGLAVGERILASVSTQSLAPTLLELMGTPVEAVPGMAPSLAALARDPRSAFPEQVVVSGGGHLDDEKIALVQGGRKTIDLIAAGRAEVYDLARDPREMEPLEDAEADVEGARRALAAWARAGEAARSQGAGPVHSELERETREQLRALGYVD